MTENRVDLDKKKKPEPRGIFRRITQGRISKVKHYLIKYNMHTLLWPISEILESEGF